MPNRAQQYRKSPPRKPDTRPCASARGYGKRWQQYRLACLASHPLCVDCAAAGRVGEASEVHHLDGRGPLGPRGYDPANLLPLCKRCHSRRTAATP